MSKNSEIKKDIDDEFESIKSMHQTLSSNIDNYLINNEDELSNFGNIQIYDYEKDIEKSQVEASDLIEKMANLYLKDAPEVLNHPYIKKKMEEDTKYYSSTQLLQKMSEKLLLQQMRQIDQGENAPKNYEVANATVAQLRENIKDGRHARTEIEKLYRDLRKEMGLNDLAQTNSNSSVIDNNKEDGQIIDTTKLNEQIEQMIKNMKS